MQARAAAHVQNAIREICSRHSRDSTGLLKQVALEQALDCKRRALEFACSPDRASSSSELEPSSFVQYFDPCCRPFIRNALQEDLEEFWIALPEKFQLPPWEALLLDDEDSEVCFGLLTAVLCMID